MIRHILIAGPAILLAACNPFASLVNNQIDARQPQARPQLPMPRIAVTATGPDNCTTTLNGRPVTMAALLERLVTEIRQAIDIQGGPANIEEFPYAEFDAPADMRFACAGPPFLAVVRSGFGDIRFGKGDGGPRTNLSIYMPEVGRPRIVVVVDGGGRLRWNGAPISLAGLRTRASQVESPVPGLLAIVATTEASVAEVLEVAQALHTSSPMLIPPGQDIPEADPSAPMPIGRH